MKQFLLDTNVLLRYLLDDVPEQVEVVEKLFKRAKQGEIILYLPSLAIVEALFVLTKICGWEKGKVVEELTNVVDNSYLRIDRRDEVKSALATCLTKNLSLVDCLICEEAKRKGAKLVTFDKKLAALAKAD